MSQVKTQIGKIAYNPAASSFEALVIFHTSFGPHWVAASFPADLSADFDAISEGLLQDALKNVGRAGALQSRLKSLSRRAPIPAGNPVFFAEPLKAA